MDLFGLKSLWNKKAFERNNALFNQRVSNKEDKKPESMLRCIFNALGLTSKARTIRLYESLEEYERKKLLGYYHPDYIRLDCLLDLDKFQADLESMGLSSMAVSYTHLTLPTKA